MNHNEFEKNAELAVVEKKMKDKETDMTARLKPWLDEGLKKCWSGSTRSTVEIHDHVLFNIQRGGGGGALIMQHSWFMSLLRIRLEASDICIFRCYRCRSRGGPWGPGAPLTPHFEAQFFAAAATTLRDVGKISAALTQILDPHML